MDLLKNLLEISQMSSHITNISSTGIFVAIDNNTKYGSKLYIFILCQKSLDIKIMFHEDILYRKYIKT